MITALACPYMSKLDPNWNNEAYVSLHLVEVILEQVGLSRRSSYSHWIPEFKISIPNSQTNNPKSNHEVDFLVEDSSRYVDFLIEVKSANNPINDDARFQLEQYLRYSGVKFGILIDPLLVEIYEFKNWKLTLRCKHHINNPNEIEPVANFVKTFLEQVKMRTIAVHTSKGGVGKTTLVVNLAWELARQGYRILVVDLDDQANASLLLGVNQAEKLDQASTMEEFEEILQSFEERKEVIEFLKNYELPGFNYQEYLKKCPLNRWINNHGCPGKIDILPSSYKTHDAGLAQLAGIREKRLDKALRKSGIADDYDYVIIDTPPSSTIVANNGLYAAQYILIPSQMEYLSAYGMRTPIKRAREVQEEMDEKRGIILGIVPFMTEKVNLHKQIKKLINKNFKGIPIFTEINKATAVGQAVSSRMPLSLYAEQKNNSRAGGVAKQFTALTNEIIAKIEEIETCVGM